MNRIFQIDFFRGLFLLIITANHFLSWENVITRFTDGFIGWVSAAEGFVFLSGLTAGLVYSRKLVEKGQSFITRAARKRAWTIYKYHFLLFLLVSFSFFILPFMEDYWLDFKEFHLLNYQPAASALLGALLVYQPTYMNILPMYALFILLLPVSLKYFQEGKPWIVLTISFVVYLIGTFDLVSRVLDYFGFMTNVTTGFFNLLSWQLLFIVGLYLGFLTYRNQTESILKSKKLFYGALALCAVLFLFKRTLPLWGTLPFDLEYWTSRENLGPLRLLNFAVLLAAVSHLASWRREWFSSEMLCYLGKHSLEVFAMQILLVFIFKPLKEFTNAYHAIQLTDHFYFFPWGTAMLFFILIPALFMAPELKNRLDQYRFRTRVAS